MIYIRIIIQIYNICLKCLGVLSCLHYNYTQYNDIKFLIRFIANHNYKAILVLTQ